MSKETILNAYVEACNRILGFQGDIDAGKWWKEEREKEGKPTAWADKAIARHTENLEKAERQMTTFARRLKVVPVEELK